MAVVIQGDISPALENRVRRCLEVAARSLELEEIVLHVTSSRRDLPRGLLAGAGLEGIWIRQSLLAEDGVFVTSTLLEEAAHLKLLALGVADGLESFAGALVHEFFAGWFTFRELLKVDPQLVARFHDGPLPPARPTAQFGYRLGALLGAAAAGVPAAQRRIENWLASNVVDPAIRAAAERVRDTARHAANPSELATALAKVQLRLDGGPCAAWHSAGHLRIGSPGLRARTLWLRPAMSAIPDLPPSHQSLRAAGGAVLLVAALAQGTWLLALVAAVGSLVLVGNGAEPVHRQPRLRLVRQPTA